MKKKLFDLGQKLFTGVGLFQTVFVVAFIAMFAGYYTSAYRITSNPEKVLANASANSSCTKDKSGPEPKGSIVKRHFDTLAECQALCCNGSDGIKCGDKYYCAQSGPLPASCTIESGKDSCSISAEESCGVVQTDCYYTGTTNYYGGSIGYDCSGCPIPPTNTPIPTAMPTPTLILTPIPTLTLTPTPTIRLTPTSTPTVTLTPTSTPIITSTPTPTVTPNPSDTPMPTPTATPTPNPSNTPTPTFTPAPTVPTVLGAAAPTIAPRAGVPTGFTFGLVQIGVIGILLRVALLLI